jgi:hypothetical protein
MSEERLARIENKVDSLAEAMVCLLYTSDAADDIL